MVPNPYLAFIWELLKNTLFGVVGNAVWDRLQPSFREHFQKNWDGLYVDAFSEAFNSQKDRLKKHSEQASLDKEQLKNVLSRTLPPEFRQKTTRDLPSTKAQKLLTKIIAKDEEIVMLSGHSFSEEEYEEQISILVKISVDIFREKIKENGDQLIDEFIKRDDEAFNHLRSLEHYLKNQFGFISSLQRTHERLESTLREGFGQESILILFSNGNLQEHINDSVTLLRNEYTRLNINSIYASPRNPAKPLRAVLSDIERCDIAIFIVVQNEYDPFIEKATQTAKKHFRRCFFIVADAAMSLILHPEPSYLSKTGDLQLTADDRRKKQQEYQIEFQAYKEEASKQSSYLDDVRVYFKTVFDFSSVEKINDQLTVIVNKTQETDWYGLSPLSIQDQWTKYASTNASYLQHNVLHDRPLLQSPLWSLWEAFLNKSWLQDVLLAFYKIQEIEKVLVKWGDVRKILEAAPSLTENIFTSEWSEIRYALLERYSPSIRKKVGNKIGELVSKMNEKGDTKTEAEKLRKEFNAWNDAFKELSSIVDAPKYGRCFLVRGRSGSGKTHFVSNLLSQQNENEEIDYRCLYLDDVLQSDKSSYKLWEKEFENLILEKAGLAIGYDEPTHLVWHTLKALDGFFCESGKTQNNPTRLVIVFDDFANWVKASPATFLSNLVRFIKTHTKYRSLTWVMTVDASDSWYFSNDEEFWREFTSAMIPWEIVVRDWIDLDAVNERGFRYEKSELKLHENKYQLLVRILTEGGIDSNKILTILTKDPLETSLKLLSTPFISWIAVDWLFNDFENVGELPNLRFIDFMELFYEKRYQEVRTANTIKEKDGKVLNVELETFIDFIAYLLASGVDQYTEQSVFEKIKEEVTSLKRSDNIVKKEELEKVARFERIANIEIITVLFDALRNNGFISVTENKIYHLDFVPFWEYKAARQFRSRMIAESSINLSEFLEINFGPSGLISDYQGIFEFLLLLSEKEIWQAAPKVNDATLQNLVSGLKELIAIAFSELVNLRPTIWVALSKASGLLQGMFTNWFGEQKLILDFETEKDFLDYLYFFRYATNVDQGTPDFGVPWDLRIKLISNHFDCLNRWSFSAGYFFKFILSALPHSAAGEKIALSIAYLHGIEYYFNSYDLIFEMTGIPYVDTKSYPRGDWTRIGKWAFDAIQYHLPSSKDSEAQLNKWMLAMVSTAKQRQNEQDDGIRGRDRIWASVLEHYYEDLVFNNGIESLSLLDEYGWLPWQREPSNSEKEIFSAIEEYYTVWLGRWWRTHSGSQERYLALLKELASSGNEYKHRTVLLTIFYTVASVRKHREAVDGRLWELFCGIWDNDKSKIIEKTKLLGFLSRFYEEQQDMSWEPLL